MRNCKRSLAADHYCKRSLAADHYCKMSLAADHHCKRSLAYRDLGEGREHMSMDGR